MEKYVDDLAEGTAVIQFAMAAVDKREECLKILIEIHEENKENRDHSPEMQ